MYSLGNVVHCAVMMCVYVTSGLCYPMNINESVYAFAAIVYRYMLVLLAVIVMRCSIVYSKTVLSMCVCHHIHDSEIRFHVTLIKL